MPKYKYCIVPCCSNTSIKCTEKYFFDIPRKANIRKKWCRAMKRDEKNNPKLSPNSSLHVCQDHFDLETDTENWMRHRLQGVHLRLKPGICPHKFECQRQSKIPNPRTSSENRKRARLIDEILSDASASASAAVPELLPSVDVPLPQEEIVEVPAKQDKALQVTLKSHVRSKATSTKWPVVNRACSPIPITVPQIYSSDEDTSTISDYEESNSEVDSIKLDFKKFQAETVCPYCGKKPPTLS